MSRLNMTGDPVVLTTAEYAEACEEPEVKATMRRAAQHSPDKKPKEEKMNILYLRYDQKAWVEIYNEGHPQRGVLVLNEDGSVGFLPEHEVEDHA